MRVICGTATKEVLTRPGRSGNLIDVFWPAEPRNRPAGKGEGENLFRFKSNELSGQDGQTILRLEEALACDAVSD